MNIGVAVYSMQAGGTERVVSILANLWVQNGHSVSVYTFDNARADSSYELSTGVEVRKFGIADGNTGELGRASSLIRKYYNLRKAMKQRSCHVLVSFASEINILVLVAMLGLKVPVVVSERSDPNVIPKGLLWRLLRRVSYYCLPAAIVVQNKHAANYFYGKVNARLLIIPNPIDPGPTTVTSPTDDDVKPKIFTVGRLVEEKRHDLLIEAIHRLIPACGKENVELVVVGEGPLRSVLEESITEFDMENSVKLVGFRSDPWDQVKHGDIYVQCSDFEGFPNALCEAMGRGCAVISTVYSPAVTEIIRDNISGILIRPNNVAELYEALRSLMASSGHRKKFGDEARKVIRRFDPEKIGSEWIRNLEEVTANVL